MKSFDDKFHTLIHSLFHDTLSNISNEKTFPEEMFSRC